MSRYTTKGFTIVEILVAIGIALTIAALTVAVFANFRNYLALRTAVSDIQTALIDARMATLSSQGDTVHGVRIATSSVTRFVGSTYSAGASTNLVFPFSYGVTASFAATPAGSADVVFTRLTGAAQTSGTITVTEPRSGRTATIMIYSSGLIEL